MRKLLIILVILILTGCATVSYRNPVTGESIDYTRLWATTDEIIITYDSNGERTIVVREQGISPELRQALQMVIGALTLGEIK